MQLFDKGLILDSLVDGSWKDARNILIGKGFEHIEPEKGIEESKKFVNPLEICGVIKTKTSLILFSTNSLEGANNISEIGILENNIYTVIVNDYQFQFNTQYEFDGIFTNNNKGDLIIAWTLGLNSYDGAVFLLNLSDLPFSVYEYSKHVSDGRFELCKMFPKLSIPIIHVSEIRETGGRLLSGTYQISIKYVYDNDDETNIFEFSPTIPIFPGNSKDSFDSVFGDDTNLPTSKMIILTLTNFDLKFKRYKLIISHATKEGVNFYETPIISSSNLTYSFSKIPDTVISLNEALVNNIVFSKCETLATLNKEIIVGNPEEDLVDLQPYVNDFTVSWFLEKDINLSTTKGSFKDSFTLTFDRLFKDGEVYAIYARGITTLGNTTKWYHIPGREATSLFIDDGTAVNETDYLRDLEGHDCQLKFQHIDKDAKVFHVFDTSTVGDTGGGPGGNGEDYIFGEMGYWENLNEVYPSNFPNSILGKTFANKPVRHHVVPTWRKLLTDETVENYLNRDFLLNPELYNMTSFDTYHYFNDVSLFKIASASFDPLPSSPDLFTISEVEEHEGAWVNHLKFVAKKDMGTSSVYLRFIGQVNNGISIQKSAIIACKITVQKYNAADELQYGIEKHANLEGEEIESWIIEHTVDFSLRENEYLKVAVLIWFLSITGDENISYSNNSYIGFNCNIEVTDATSVRHKKISLAISNIEIPTIIKEKIVGLQFAFADRTGNKTILGQAIAFEQNTADTADNIPKANYDNPLRLYSPDLKFSKPAGATYFVPTFIVGEQDLTPVINLKEVSYLDPTDIYKSAFVENENFFLVKDLQYLQNNNIIQENKQREETLIFDIEDHEGNSEITLPIFDPDLSDKVIIGNLKAHVKDIYVPFYDQDLIITGEPLILSTGTSYMKFLSNGDSYLCDYNFRMTGRKGSVINYEENGTGFFVRVYLMSDININLRHDTDNYHDVFPPKTGLGSIFYLHESEGILNCELDIKILFETAFNKLNKYKVGLIHDGSEQQISFPFRLLRGYPLSTENKSLRWRNFGAINYYELLSADRGEIVKLDVVGNALIIRQRYAMFIAMLKDVLRTEKTKDTLDAYLGTGDIFDRPPQEISNSEIGNIGCQSKYSSLSTKFGYITFDNNTGKIILYNEKEGLIDLTKNVQDFFIEQLKNFIPSNQRMNPYLGTNVSLGWDNITNRLLVSKSAAPGIDTEEFTLSFDEKLNKICFHDYIPTLYISTEDALYSIHRETVVNQGTTTIYVNTIGKHNHDSIATYLGRIPSDSYIDFVFLPDSSDLNKLFNTVVFQTEVFSSTGEKLPLKTVDKIAVFTNNECTGYISITDINALIKNRIEVTNDIWTVKGINNIVKNPDQIPLNPLNNLLTPELLVNNNYLFKNWFDITNIKGKFAVVRLFIDNTEQNITKIKSVAITHYI